MAATQLADFFDGRRARPHPVRLSVADGQLHVEPLADDGPPAFAVPLAQVTWPERTRHGARIARLPDGASLQSADSAAWDAWAAAHGRHDAAVVRAQQSWRGVLAALVLLLGVGSAAYLWGLPALARGAVAMTPAAVDALVGAQAMQSLDGRLVHPSQMPAAEQARLRAAFADAVTRTWGADAAPWRLEFRAGRPPGEKRGGLGPNAFALPGGTIVLTDELVARMQGDEEAVIGVLGHEFGHVRHRHGMRQLVQVSALSAIGALVFGDYGSFVGSVPLVLASMGYSRDAEREADTDAIALLQATGRSPLGMVRFFEALAERGDPAAGLGIALSSHPPDAERIARFRAAAGR